MHSLGPSHHNQVENEYLFIRVFSPEVGNTIHFLPQKRPNRELVGLSCQQSVQLVENNENIGGMIITNPQQIRQYHRV